jgi:hypothetical protein
MNISTVKAIEILSKAKSKKEMNEQAKRLGISRAFFNIGVEATESSKVKNQASRRRVAIA